MKFIKTIQCYKYELTASWVRVKTSLPVRDTQTIPLKRLKQFPFSYRERSGLSPVPPENDSSKSNRGSPDVDIDLPAATKIGHYSEEGKFCVIAWMRVKWLLSLGAYYNLMSPAKKFVNTKAWESVFPFDEHSKLRLFYCWKNLCCLFGSLFLRHLLQGQCKHLNMAISSGCHGLMQIFSIKARFIVQSLMRNVHKTSRNSSEPYIKYNKIPGCNNFATTNVTE